MDFNPKRRRVQVLDYFSMVESNSEKCQAQTDEARRDSIRATCNVCHRAISGSFRVKSNFLTHLRKSHPEVYVDYQLRTGKFPDDEPTRNSLLSAALERPRTTSYKSEAHSSQAMLPADNFGSLVPMHMPTSTVKDGSSASSPVGSIADVQTIKVEVDESPVPFPKRKKALPPQQAANEALMDFIIGDLMPTALVESPRFARFLSTVNPSYRLPKLMDVTEVVENTHARHQMMLSDRFNSVRTLYLSRELWPTQGGRKLVTYTAHYINNWSLQHVLLSSSHLCESSNTDGFFSSTRLAVDEIIKDAKVVETVNCLTPVFHLPGFSKLEPDVSDGLLDEGQLGFGFLLDQVVVKSLRGCSFEVLDLLIKMSRLLSLADVDWSCDVHNIEAQPWFDQLKVLNAISLNMDATFREKISSQVPADLVLGDNDVLLLSKVTEVLRPFLEVAERVRQTNSVTCSLAFASIMLLKAALKDLGEAYPNFQLVTKLGEQFRSATSSIDDGNSNAYTTATLLDPRFKLQWCDLDKQNDFKKGFIETAKSVEIVKVESDSDAARSVPPQAGGFFTRILKQQPESVQAGTITSEVLRYFDEPLMPEDCDVLNYWQSNESVFPHLAQLAQQYLAMPTSAANISSFFSLPGQVLDFSNTPLSGPLFQQMTTLKSNLKH